MNIRDYIDIDELKDILDTFTNTTGIAAIAVDAKGEYIVEPGTLSNVSSEYAANSQGAAKKSATDFSVDIIVNNEKAGSVFGGIVDGYDSPCASNITYAEKLIQTLLNNYVTLVSSNATSDGKLSKLQKEINHSTEIIQKINTNTHSLKSIANKQKMLSLNASIEAARSGEAGVGFAVVAKSMGELSSQSATIYGDIDKSVIEVTESIEKLASLFEN